MFDIMLVRIDEHLDVDVNSDVELGIKLSDGIVFISNYTKNDFMACFANENSIQDKQLKVIYPATGLSNSEKSDYELPFSKYFLVIGNSFKHKAIQETIEAISSTQHSYIVVGHTEDELIYSNVYGYKTGHHDDDFLSYLYANCEAVVFPSLYEGFGLPIAISLKNNKRVILKNNEINHELMDHFHQFKEYFLFFDKFEQIGEIIDKTDFGAELAKNKYDDSWDRVAAELETFFDEILKAEVDTVKLNNRWSLFKLIEAKSIEANKLIDSQRAQLQSLHNQFNDYKLLSLLFFAIKEHVKKRHTKLFNFIKKSRA